MNVRGWRWLENEGSVKGGGKEEERRRKQIQVLYCTIL